MLGKTIHKKDKFGQPSSFKDSFGVWSLRGIFYPNDNFWKTVREGYHLDSLWREHDGKLKYSYFTIPSKYVPSDIDLSKFKIHI